MKQTLSNASWLLLGYIGRVASQLIGVSIIARVLTPLDFGVAAVAFVVSNLAGLLLDLGTGPAAIRSRDPSPHFMGGIYSIQLIISILLASAISLSAQDLARFYHMESLTRVLIILAWVFPITALGGVYQIALEKKERFKTIAIIELVSYVLGLAAAVFLARFGFGVESIAFQAVIAAAAGAFFFRLSVKKAILPKHPRNARSAAGSSAALTAYQLFSYVVRNSDTAVAGRMASTAFVGSYSMASRISKLPSQTVGLLLSRVSVPMLSKPGREKEDTTLQIGNLIEVACLLSAWACVVLASLRTCITAILFGPQWIKAVPPELVFLLPASALISVNAVIIAVITALGATTRLIRIGAVSAFFQIGFLIGCLGIKSHLLPFAIYLSSIATISISSLELRDMLKRENYPMPSINVIIPLIAIVLYPVYNGLPEEWMNLGRRGVALESFEAFALSSGLSVVGVMQYRKWRRRPTLWGGQS